MYSTDHLLIRAYEESDKPGVERMLNDAAIQRTTNPFPNQPSAPSNTASLITSLQAALFFGVLALKDKPEELIGWVILRGTSGNPQETAKNRTVMFGITIMQPWQGKGYGTEATKFTVDWAFRMGGLHRVWLGVYDGNDRAKKTYKKASVRSILSSVIKLF
jgi:RimJ/RimL family protein N-acetyltransferase